MIYKELVRLNNIVLIRSEYFYRQVSKQPFSSAEFVIMLREKIIWHIKWEILMFVKPNYS